VLRKKKAQAERTALVEELNYLNNELDRLRAFPKDSRDTNYRWGISFSNDDLRTERDELVEAVKAEAAVVAAKESDMVAQDARITEDFTAGLERLRAGLCGDDAYGVLLHLHELKLEARELRVKFLPTSAQEEELTKVSLDLASDPAARRAAQRMLLRDYLMRFEGDVADVAQANLDHFLTPEVLVRHQHRSPVSWEDALLTLPGGFRREPLVVACIRGDRRGADITGLSEAEVETLAVLLSDDPDADVTEAVQAARALEDA
jgi:hypothetical protein